MISAQCVRKNVYGCNHKEEWVALKDRYDKRFPAVCVCNPWKMENTDPQMPCYNIIYNSIPYGLLKERVQTENLGLFRTQAGVHDREARGGSENL